MKLQEDPYGKPGVCIPYKQYGRNNVSFPAEAYISGPINVEGLLKLAEIIERFDTDRAVIPVAKFDLGSWVGVKYNGLHPFCDKRDDPRILFTDLVADNAEVVRAHKCETTACAIGFGTLHPYFRRRGLTTAHALSKYLLCSNYGLEGYLFMKSSYAPTHRGRKEVVARIRKVVALYERHKDQLQAAA